MKSINEQHNFLAGFVLIELLVVISIILLLVSGLAMVNRSSSQKQQEILLASQRLRTDLRQVQNMAVSGKKQGTIMPAGYGLYVADSGQYKIFYNKIAEETDRSRRYNEIADNSIDIGTIKLPLGISLSPINVTIFFVSPDPTTYINGVNSGSQDFILASDSESKKVEVYSSGLIKID